MVPRTLRYSVISFLFLLMMVSIYLYSYRPHLYQWPHSAAAVLPLVTCPALPSPCVVSLPENKTFSIHLNTTKLPVLSPLYIEATTNDFTVHDVSITFSDIATQNNQLTLNQEREGVFIAKTILPSTPMIIKMTLFLTRGTTHYRIPIILRDENLAPN